MSEAPDTGFRVAVAGFGAIGQELARALTDGGPHRLVAIGARDPARTAEACRAAGIQAPVVPTALLPGDADVVMDAAPSHVFAELAQATLEAGRILLTVNAAALLDRLDLIELARRRGGRIVLATGALLGLDAVRAAARGNIASVRMITAKPPKAFLSVPYVKALGISLDQLSEPVRLFAGSAREGAQCFPSNVNVAASLALAGLGPDETQLEVWADPKLVRNTHRIEVDADSAAFQMQIQNIPTDANPSTGRLTALSVLDALDGLTASLRVGS